MSSNLFQKMTQMESQSAVTLNQLQEQRRQLHGSLKVQMESFIQREVHLRAKVQSLEQSVLNVTLDRVENEEMERKQKDLNEQIDTLKQLLDQEKDKREQLTRELFAYKKTIKRGDDIINKLTKEYRDKIHNLEMCLSESKDEVNKLKQELSSVPDCSRRREIDSEENSRLLEELMESESREVEMRNKLCKYERNEIKLKEKLGLLIKEKSDLENEIQDQEAILTMVFKLKKDLDHLKRTLSESEQEKDHLNKLFHESCFNFETKERNLIQDIKKLNQEIKRLEKENKSIQDSFESGFMNKIGSTSTLISTPSQNGNKFNGVTFEIVRPKGCCHFKKTRTFGTSEAAEGEEPDFYCTPL